VLLVRRANSPEQGRWALPAGFIDAGELPEQAAARECLEETGLKVKITGLLDVIGGREHPQGADIVILYRGEVLEGQLTPGDDADALGYFSQGEMPPLAFEATRRALSHWLADR
jgi:ADP-ribose pyrophosphatase YjhB (NUDIX family)